MQQETMDSCTHHNITLSSSLISGYGLHGRGSCYGVKPTGDGDLRPPSVWLLAIDMQNMEFSALLK